MTEEAYLRHKLQEMTASYELVKLTLLEICDYLKTTDKQEISSSLVCLTLNLTFEDRNQVFLLIHKLSKTPESFTLDNVKKELIQKIPKISTFNDEDIRYLVNMISVQYTTKKLTI